MNGKYILTAVASATLLLLCACQRVLDTDENGTNNPVVDAVETVQFTAWTTQMDNGAPGTKTYLDNLFIKWDSVNDRISVFSTGGANTECSITSLENDGTKAIFSGSVPASDSYLAVYPYNSEFTGDPSTGTVTAVIPTEQLIPSGMNVAPQSMVSVAMANQANEFTFANVFGVMQLTISADDITSVTVEGNTEAKLSSKVTIAENGGNPTITNIAGQGVAHVTIKPQGGGAFAPGTYYAIMLPNALSDGFKVIFTKSDGTVGARSWSNSQGGIVRNSGIDIGSTAPTKWRNALVAREVANTATSSTLTFEWSENDFNDAAADLARDYRFALYSDPGCSDLILAWNTPKTNVYNHGNTEVNIFYGSTPRFTFTGLSANTTYYFKVYDSGYGIKSSIIEATTADFTPVTLPSGDASVGDIILAEDFSELIYGGDLVNRSAGYCNENRETNKSFISAAGNLKYYTPSEQDEYLISLSSEYGISKALSVPAANSRLATWGVLREGGSGDGLYSRAGYVKLGTSSYAASLLTPTLSCIPDGMKAKVEVSFKAMDYVGLTNVADQSRARIAVYNGGNNNASYPIIIDKNTGSIVSGETFDLTTGWQSYTYTLEGVTNACRIMFGWEATSSTAHPRMYYDDIVIKIIALDDLVAKLPVKWTIGISGHNYSNTWPTANGTATQDGVTGYINSTTGIGTIWFDNSVGRALESDYNNNNSATNANTLLDVSGNDPRVKGAYKGDYCQFKVPGSVSAGKKVRITFETRTSASHPKYWKLIYLDGDTWKPACTVQTATDSDSTEISYTHEMNADGSTNVQVDATVEYSADTDDIVFRFVCASKAYANGSAPKAYPNGGTWRLSLTTRAADNMWQPTIQWAED